VKLARHMLENAQTCELAQVVLRGDNHVWRHSKVAVFEIQRDCEGLRQFLFQKDSAYPDIKTTLQDGNIERSVFDSRQKTTKFSLLHHQVSEKKVRDQKPTHQNQLFLKPKIIPAALVLAMSPPPPKNHIFWGSCSNNRPYKFTFIYS
jgi:hypothetical protein